MYLRGEELRIESRVTTVRKNCKKIELTLSDLCPYVLCFSSLVFPHALIWSSGFYPRLVSSLVPGVC